MDLVSLGFLIVIVLLGGVSAFAADSLGWRIGKRRHSMFGMRPKHFARLVVTITGALIPFATILFLAFASQDVRVWITQGRRAVFELSGVVAQRDQAQEELRGLQRASRELQTQNRASAAQLRTQEVRYREQAARLQAQTVRLQQASVKIGVLTPKLALLTQRANQRQIAVDRLALANERVRRSLNEATSTLRGARTNLAALRGEFNFVRREKRQAVADKAQAVSDRDDARRASALARETYNDIQKRNVQLTQDNLTLETSISRLTSEVAELNDIAAEAKRATKVAQDDVSETQVQLRGLQAAREQLQDELNAYKGDAQQTRTQPLTFRARDELARLVVPEGASVADARGLINSVLRQARIEADRRGARPTPSGVLPAMRAADLPELTSDGRVLTASDQIERLAAQIAGGKTDVVLVARAALNFFTGEAVALRLSSYPDPVVFQAGEVVAEGRLDSRRGDAGVYAQINEFLGSRVQERARQAKLIPVRLNGEESYGEVPPEQILEAIRVAGAEPRAYRLQAVATANIRAGDRLKIELRLK